MKNLNFSVDEQKCIHCGQCIKDCMPSVLEFNENKIPKAANPERCIACGHCFSVCPVGAISIFDKKSDDAEQIYSQNPDMILNLIKSRRSCRQYKNENVSAEIINKLKNMLKWSPTGCNYHGLHFSIIDNNEVMDEFRNHVNTKILSALQNKSMKLITEKFSRYTKGFINGEDIIFRGAPHMIVVSNSIKAPCAKEDAIIALSYFELYAQSLGLGTCWCGYGQTCMKLFPELSEYLEIPEGYQSEYVMLFGYRNVNYCRTTEPFDVQITTAEKGGFEKLSATTTIKRYFWNFIR